MNPRVFLAVVPPLALLAGAFALRQLYIAVLAARAANWPFAVFYLVFGVAGLAIATGLGRLWLLRRRLLAGPAPR